MPLTLYHIDAFTDRPLTGNPASVVFLTAEADAQWMQAIGSEMNHPETAFLRPLAGQPGHFELRWFTPTVEVDLCGHATIASAHAVWQDGRVPNDEPIYFHTRSGLLTATRSGDLIELDFPSVPISEAAPPDGLLAALGLEPAQIHFVGCTKFDTVLELDTPERLRNLAPNQFALAQVATRGAIVTSRSDDERFDYLARFFAPAAGIPEDPVTGSAHCALAPYWQSKLGKDKFTAYQASPRGGVIHTKFRGDRITLAGQAVTIARGELQA